jgi:hypothetical protein
MMERIPIEDHDVRVLALLQAPHPILDTENLSGAECDSSKCMFGIQSSFDGQGRRQWKLLGHLLASIHSDDLSVDVTAQLGAQEENDAGDVFRLPESAERRVLEFFLPNAYGNVGRHPGLNPSRRDGIDPNPEPT